MWLTVRPPERQVRVVRRRRRDATVSEKRSAARGPSRTQRVAHGDRPGTVRPFAAHGDVAPEFHDHAAGVGDVIGDEVHDERLGAGAEVELTRRIERDRVLDRGRDGSPTARWPAPRTFVRGWSRRRRVRRSRGRSRGRAVPAGPSGRPGRRSTSRGAKCRLEGQFQRGTDRHGLTVTLVESGEFGVVAESIARRVEGVQPVPESLGRFIHLSARARWRAFR